MKLLSVVICSLMLACECYAADLTITEGEIQHVLTSDDLKKLHAEIIDIQDPVYKKHKHYSGYWLSDVLDLAGISPDSINELVFKALDGYEAHLIMADKIKNNAKGFIAIKDLDAQEGWEKILQGKQWISPGPYYLVWKDAPTEAKLPWPYQMVEIIVHNVAEPQEKPLPESDSQSDSVARGVTVFKQNCVSCHSLNLEGGELGPELNVPRNIFEYRDRDTVREFNKDPNSFRAKSKMPTFKEKLSKESIENVMDYLAWMGQHKK
jgi:mono/diheme cytochrome c family protein